MSEPSVDTERKFHESWLGMAQPLDGLVVSVPALLEAQCFGRVPLALQERLRELCPERAPGGPRAIGDLSAFFREILGLAPERFDRDGALPRELSLYVPEGAQSLRPTLALRRPPGPAPASVPGAETPASEAGAAYQLLVWDLAPHVGLPLDAAEQLTGPWSYPPMQKLDRLLRACRVPIGLLTNREVVRLVYAPHGESTGSISFRLDDLASPGGKPLLDAFVTLLSESRLYGLSEDQRLPAVLRQSRLRQADVTGALAGQILEALQLLLEGFDAAAGRDQSPVFREALQSGDAVYGGLLTVLLRLVFLLYAEEHGLLPVEHEHYAQNLSLLGLFADLQADAGAYPDSMARRFGAWPRLVALFRAVFLGVRHGSLVMPPRHGELFDPERFPFLEGRSGGGAAPVKSAEERARVRLPSVDDGTLLRLLERLLYLREPGKGGSRGQRLSYRALDVEQIGSVYESLMGYHVRRLPSAAILAKRPAIWIAASDLLALSPRERQRHLVEELGLDREPVRKAASAIAEAQSEDELLSALEPLRRSRVERAPAGRLVLVPGPERRRTSSHYTPRGLSAPIVRSALEPLLASLSATPLAPEAGEDRVGAARALTSSQILSLQICDPAMGSGAFLVEACRFLGDQLVAAWTREGTLGPKGLAAEDAVTKARRLVAQRCLYGVDKNPFAVGLAKLSMWLVTLAKDEPFTFLDHALRHGDSLVGLAPEQLAAFDWSAGTQLPICHQVVAGCVARAREKRLEILALAERSGAEAAREKERLLEEAEGALARARLVGDVALSAFFGGENEKGRQIDRDRLERLLLLPWLEKGGPPPPELVERQRALRERTPAFHWPLEFPEVFAKERPAGPGFDAFVGNPPFAGKNSIAELGIEAFLPWLQTVHPGAHGNADLVAHFFRRAFSLLAARGSMGLIATNTVGQGDSRASGLQWILAHGGRIAEATRSMPWPGDASVSVAVVQLAKGELPLPEPRLDGAPVPAINSRLRGSPERPDPVPLRANAGLSYVGSYVLGMGFTLTPDERDELVRRDPKNGERIFPYLGGEEVNSSPTQSFDRYVINFGALSLEEAERWPDLLAIVREKVKPERDRQNREIRKRYWWRFGESTPALYAALAGKRRCLVCSRVSKHLVFAWQPADRVFADRLYAFPLEDAARFAVLQSRLHEPWARLLSSTLEDRLNYAASDCFDPFPFPPAEALRGGGPLDLLGERLNDARARYLVRTNQGLTQCYNRLRDPACHDPEVVSLRALHEELDREVRSAYGWPDLELPPYASPRTPAEQAALARFEDELIDRLFALNAARAAQERLEAPRAPKPKPPRKPKGSQPSLFEEPE